MWIVYIGREAYDWATPDIVVIRRTLQSKLKDTICRDSSANKDDTVEKTQIVKTRDKMNAPRTALLEVFVFDAQFVVAHGLFALYSRGRRLEDARTREGDIGEGNSQRNMAKNSMHNVTWPVRRYRPVEGLLPVEAGAGVFAGLGVAVPKIRFIIFARTVTAKR